MATYECRPLFSSIPSAAKEPVAATPNKWHTAASIGKARVRTLDELLAAN